MFEAVKSLGTVSRAEFLLPNLGSLIMGLAWGAIPSTSILDLVAMMLLSFSIINLSSAIGAQVNTFSDRELDSKDHRKKQLVEAINSFGACLLKKVLVIEFALTLVLVFVFMAIQQKPILLLLWIIGISLGYAYSAPPLRLKSRSWVAPVTLILVLAVFPVLFAYYSFTSEMNPFFILSLVGLALTVYGVIIPTEIRDYFGDKAMDIETMTVRLGLAKASLLGIVLLTLGAVFTGTAFILEWTCMQHSWLSVFLLAIPAAVLFVLRKIMKLYSLSKQLDPSNSQKSVAEDIVNLSAHNPQWIMLVTQTYSLMSIILLVSKFLF
ncbi:MAG: UbiA family prenyltransferase [Candidatus Bathyarchaeota archaeon]|nr:UbiA family prenyltransferase [Candidatus Bathyarchaeota archaeon]MDH5787127.1 UbiA family prenyltransferase [Candidatus Bathyarchaeota archaeon]